MPPFRGERLPSHRHAVGTSWVLALLLAQGAGTVWQGVEGQSLPLPSPFVPPGAEATYRGFVADRECVNRRVALDGADMWYQPQHHTLPCLLMPVCVASGYCLLLPSGGNASADASVVLIANTSTWGCAYNFSSTDTATIAAAWKDVRNVTDDLYVRLSGWWIANDTNASAPPRFVPTNVTLESRTNGSLLLTATNLSAPPAFATAPLPPTTTPEPTAPPPPPRTRCDIISWDCNDTYWRCLRGVPDKCGCLQTRQKCLVDSFCLTPPLALQCTEHARRLRCTQDFGCPATADRFVDGSGWIVALVFFLLALAACLGVTSYVGYHREWDLDARQFIADFAAKRNVPVKRPAPSPPRSGDAPKVSREAEVPELIVLPEDVAQDLRDRMHESLRRSRRNAREDDDAISGRTPLVGEAAAPYHRQRAADLARQLQRAPMQGSSDDSDDRSPVRKDASPLRQWTRESLDGAATPLPLDAAAQEELYALACEEKIVEDEMSRMRQHIQELLEAEKAKLAFEMATGEVSERPISSSLPPASSAGSPSRSPWRRPDVERVILGPARRNPIAEMIARSSAAAPRYHDDEVVEHLGAPANAASRLAYRSSTFGGGPTASLPSVFTQEDQQEGGGAPWRLRGTDYPRSPQSPPWATSAHVVAYQAAPVTMSPGSRYVDSGSYPTRTATDSSSTRASCGLGRPARARDPRR